MKEKIHVSIGDKFNHWVVIGLIPYSRNRTSKFLCRCECGNEKTVYRSHLIDGQSRSCGCMKPKGSRVYNWTGCGELTGDKWNQIVRSANGKKGRTPITLNITIQEAWELFEKQGRKCALTGLDINLNGREGTASLDRIDSNQGYIHGNIQWVHKDINRMKNVYSQERFIQCCNLVAKIHPYGASCEWKPPEEKK